MAAGRVGLDRRNVLLIALARIGEATADIRRASGLRAPAAARQRNMLERAIGEATARRVK